MKDLHEVVIDALNLHADAPLAAIALPPASRRIVIGSGNALPTGRILFGDEPAVFANESMYPEALRRDAQIDSAVLISASGAKHAPTVVRDLLARGIETHLLTCSADSPAAELLPPGHVHVTRSQPEPITYNTSSYLGMILSKTGESPRKIERFLRSEVAPLVPDMGEFLAFFLIVPPAFDLVCEMFTTKFDELFGGRLNGRCYTCKQAMHAKTVVQWEKEFFIGLGYNNRSFGISRLNIDVPAEAGFATLIAVGYYVIGRIQAQFPDWFKQSAAQYEALQQSLFR